MTHQFTRLNCKGVMASITEIMIKMNKKKLTYRIVTMMMMKRRRRRAKRRRIRS